MKSCKAVPKTAKSQMTKFVGEMAGIRSSPRPSTFRVVGRSKCVPLTSRTVNKQSKIIFRTKYILDLPNKKSNVRRAARKVHRCQRILTDGVGRPEICSASPVDDIK